MQSSFYNSEPVKSKIYCNHKSSGILLVVIAFNVPDVVELQIKSLKKYLTDDFCYVVADNSTSSNSSKQILRICKRERVSYYKLPPNPFTDVNPSQSHGAALNWAYHNVIKDSKSPVVGTLDHDIFLNKSYSIIKRIGSKTCLGVINRKNSSWYLWPGFCFFKQSAIKDKRIDYFPSPGLDTGGGNWKAFFSKLSSTDCIFLNLKNVSLDGGNNKQRDKIQIIDGSWSHLVNAANWANIEDMSKKEEWLRQLAKSC